MSDLTPKTRDEMLLSGENLEPKNRKEMFLKRIYDKTQSVPEPETREEYFLKKAGDASGDITIEQLNVTESGTYAEQGKAYSPVVVNVPSYLVKDVPNLPQAVASFDDAIVAPIIKLKADIEAVQSGSGDPSPSNIRPISGWDGANVWVQAEVDPTAEADYSISWQTQSGTVYGGNFKLFKDGGKWYCTVTADRAYVNLGTLTWNYGKPFGGANEFFWTSGLSDVAVFPNVTTQTDAVCSCFYAKSANEMNNHYFTTDGAFSLYNNWVIVHDNAYTDATTFKTAMNGVQLVYELATPTTTTFEISTEIATLLGDNNIFADCGDIEECRYVTDVI